MKKSLIVLCLLSLAILPLVSAAIYGSPAEGLQTLLYGARDIVNVFTEFLFNIGFYDEFIFAKFLIFLIIFVVTYTVLKKIEFFKRPIIAFVIAASMSILAVRYIPSNDFLNAMLLPYSVYGIAITMLLPFIVFFYFVHHSVQGSTGRKIAWILFAGIFFGMWIQRRTELGDANWIYWGGIGAVLIAIVMDPTIHRYFEIGKWNKTKRSMIETQILNLKAENDRFYPLASRGDEQAKRHIAENNKSINELYNDMNKFHMR